MQLASIVKHAVMATGGKLIWVCVQRATTNYKCAYICSVYLCDRIRPEHYPGNRLTCHQIWHEMWKNGEERPPPRVGRDIQMRPLGKKRRRGRREDGGSNEEEEQEEQEDAEQEEVHESAEEVGPQVVEVQGDTEQEAEEEEDAEHEAGEEEDAEHEAEEEEAEQEEVGQEGEEEEVAVVGTSAKEAEE